MTKSDNPQNNGAIYAQQQQQQNPGHQPPPAHHNPGFANPNALPQHGQAPMAHGQPPQAQAHQQVTGQLPPPGSSYESHGEYAAPQGYQPVAEGPVDDYQYPQGQSGLPEVPAVAIPPALRSPADQMIAAVTPQMPEMQQQVADSGYSEQGASASTGEQISQRLAQLQNQYDQEISAENWVDPQGAQAAAHQSRDHFTAQQPVSDEYAGQIPQPYAENEHYAPPAGGAQNYQEQPAQAFEQVDQAYQEPQQAQFAPPPPVQAPQGSYEYAGPTPDSAHHQNPHEDHLYGNGSSIPQMQPAGGGIKKAMFGGAFIAALAVGGGAAYIFQYTDFFGPRTASRTAPTIKAASSPVKILKKKIASAGDSINKAMHNRLSRTDSSTNKVKETGIVEKVVDLGGDNVAAASKGLMPDTSKSISDKTAEINVPRRVKTLIVRPDGTILRPAGAKVEQVKKKAVKKKVSIIAPAPANSVAVPKAGAFTAASGNKIRRMKTIGEASSARILGEKSLSPPKKVIAKPARQQVVKKTTAPQVVKAKKPIIVANIAPKQSTGNVGKPFVVQVTSRSSQTSALAAFADMRQKYPNLIGTFSPDIQRADLGAKGIWYRLRVGPVGSKVAASDLCSSLKQAGHPGCFVRRK